MIRLETIKSFDNWEQTWDAFSKANPVDLTIAVNPRLRQFFLDYFHYKDFYHFVMDGDKVVGLFPAVLIDSRLVALPHFSYGGLLLNKDISDAHELILKEVEAACSKYELRGFDKFGSFNSDAKVTSWLHLEESGELQMKAFKSKLRSQIRKGSKNGLVSEFGGAELVNDFYNVYARNMHQLGSPVLPKSFFEALIRVCEEDEACIFVVKYGNEIVGGSFVLSYMGFSEVCWASTLRKYNNLSPNMVLYWAMIEYAADRGKDIFSFGRSSKDSSTLRFKKQWGAVQKQLYFNFEQEKKMDIKKAEFLTKIWSKMPFGLSKLVGPPIAKRIY